MTSTLIEHKARTINAIRRNPDTYVYWRNSLLNTVWRVQITRTVKGQLQVRVIHPIFSGSWFAVDSGDQIFQQ